LSTQGRAQWYDARQPREDDDPLLGAEQRVAGRQHEPVVGRAA
jgi:hypothetical protein